MDKVIFLPCRQSPHKLSKQNAADKHRLHMCQLATANLPWAEVDDFDLISPPPSYSWRTAEEMKARYPDAELFWLMGTDQWDSLHRWNNIEHLTELVQFIVFTRGSSPSKKEGLTCTPLYGSHLASATKIRNTLQSPQSIAWLHPNVAKYMAEKELYS